ncbi:MAG: hypothetical protein CBD58_04525 [bacterium TMED198]|nr:MAG: hypothetical protein CBD58_04525 [bacterium TMED198]|tara:strand:- start:2500 stop:2928 length:429 start_codon:yes stop_codon:yes gene_type:complete
MSWEQVNIKFEGLPRGFNLITDTILDKIPQIKSFRIGLLNIFLKHTSASLSINENACSDVRQDLESYFNKFVPENEPYYRHTLEGSDDMPAHIKSSILGSSLSVPISSGRLNLGTWQGIFLCEHRSLPHTRTLTATINGEKY